MNCSLISGAKKIDWPNPVPYSYKRRFERGGVTPLQLSYFVTEFMFSYSCAKPPLGEGLLPFLLPPLSVCRRITFFAIQVDVYKK